MTDKLHEAIVRATPQRWRRSSKKRKRSDVMKLTLMQRALRPVLNWTVERYFPNGCFFGKEYFDTFRTLAEDERSHLGQASALWITHNMHDQDADELDMKIKGLTIRGEPVGDFHIVVTRTRPKDLAAIVNAAKEDRG